MKERDEEIAQFLEGYFHQDWDLDATSWEEVVKRYVRDVGRAKAASLSRKLRHWLATTPGDSGGIMYAYDCYYDPFADGFTGRDWMSRVAALIESE